jgi:hypothetical protein
MTDRLATPEEIERANRTPLFPVPLIAALLGFSVIPEPEIETEIHD